MLMSNNNCEMKGSILVLSSMAPNLFLYLMYNASFYSTAGLMLPKVRLKLQTKTERLNRKHLIFTQMEYNTVIALVH